MSFASATASNPVSDMDPSGKDPSGLGLSGPSENTEAASSPSAPKPARYLRLPFAARGLLLAAFALYLVLGPARVESDVIASIVGYALLTLIAATSLSAYFQARILRERLKLRCSAELFEEQSATNIPSTPIAGSATRVVTSLAPISLIPFTVLEIELGFERPGVRPARHVVAGRSQTERLLIEDLTFPHRGQWRCAAVRCRVRDVFGLSRVEWLDIQAAKGIAVEVRPPERFETSVPVVSSSVRAGDALSDLVERQGEPFDLKPYHPADGMRRVLWKVFAKRGELIARHPERAVTPEGQVICFVLADQHADHVCGEAIRYAHMLEGLDLQLWFGCSGMRRRQAARTSKGLESLLIESVWDASDDGDTQFALELQSFLSGVQNALQHSRLEKIVLFVSQGNFRSEKNALDFASALSATFHLSTQPLIVAIPEPLTAAALLGNRGSRLSWLDRLIFGAPAQRPPADPSFFKKFLLICAARGWEVIIP